jgi:hypothetical protein
MEDADGTFVYTGFKPAWFMLKKRYDSTDDWHMYLIIKVNPSNVVN